MKIIKYFIIFSFFTISILSFIFYQQYQDNLQPINKTDSIEIDFEIKNGTPLSLVIKNLENKQLIRNYYLTRFYYKLNHKNYTFKAGKYKLSKSFSLERILNKFINGEIYEEKKWFTIPEGYSIKKISKLIEKNGLSSKKYREYINNPKKYFNNQFVFIDKLSNNTNLEGYLFPSTYNIANKSEKDIVRDQLRLFEKKIYQSWLDRPIDWKMSFQKTLTLTSIVELEAVKHNERRTIAGVFISRLIKGIPLGSDPTVEYALGWHQNEKGLTYNDIKVKSPYNTYIYPGLTPGPISNPGLATFKEVLNYEKTPYLYFVAKGDGSHIFTKTYREHLNAQYKIKTGQL